MVIADLAKCLETFPVVRDIPLKQLFVAENLVTCSLFIFHSSVHIQDRVLLLKKNIRDKSLMACNEGCFGVLKKYKKLVDLKPQNKDPHAQ